VTYVLRSCSNVKDYRLSASSVLLMENDRYTSADEIGANLKQARSKGLKFS